MRERPWELIAYLIDADDIARAWTEGLRAAENGTSLHPQQWDDLVDRYGKVDPVAVLPVMAQLIDDRLVEANTRAYPGAVRRMKKPAPPHEQPDTPRSPTNTSPTCAAGAPVARP